MTGQATTEKTVIECHFTEKALEGSMQIHELFLSFASSVDAPFRRTGRSR